MYMQVFFKFEQSYEGIKFFCATEINDEYSIIQAGGRPIAMLARVNTVQLEFVIM